MQGRQYPPFTKFVLFYQYNTTEGVYKENKNPILLTLSDRTGVIAL